MMTSTEKAVLELKRALEQASSEYNFELDEEREYPIRTKLELCGYEFIIAIYQPNEYGLSDMKIEVDLETLGSMLNSIMQSKSYNTKTIKGRLIDMFITKKKLAGLKKLIDLEANMARVDYNYTPKTINYRFGWYKVSIEIERMDDRRCIRYSYSGDPVLLSRIFRSGVIGMDPKKRYDYRSYQEIDSELEKFPIDVNGHTLNAVTAQDPGNESIYHMTVAEDSFDEAMTIPLPWHITVDSDDDDTK